MLTLLKFIIKFFIFYFFIFTFFSCASTNNTQILQQKIPPEKLKSDFILLKKILEANHPSLYWYTPKDSVDTYFSNAINNITDSLTEFQFKNKVAYVVSKIRCGHTAVRHSKAYYKAIEKKLQPQFPLAIKTWSDSLIVLGSALKNDAVFKRGTIITSINGIGNKQLLDSMFQFISADGYADNFKSQSISFNFPAYYKNAFGLNNEYKINYIDSLGNLQTINIYNYNPSADSLNKTKQFLSKSSKKIKLLSERNLVFDTAINTGFMRLTTFSNAGLRRFFRTSFKKLQKNNTKNLVIDLRENGGGSMFASTLLTKYLINHPFHNADTIAAISRSFKYHQYIHPWFEYWIAMHFMSRKQPDGRYHLHHYEQHFFKPKMRHHFTKQIYIVQGGYTFSAAVMFVSNLKDQQNVTVVGEETGGGSYGNSSVHLPEIILPNSGLRVVLPLYRVVFNNANSKTGRGIFPDIEIQPSSAAIKNGVDIKLQFIKEIIKNKN
ncbi:MAG: S41 family peptidase [Chitinophagaceae bacterium]